MPLEIKIIGDADEIWNTITSLYRTLHRPDIETMLIDELLVVAKRRYLEAGFTIVVAQQRQPEDAPTEAEAEAIVDKIEQSLEPKRKGRKVTPPVTPETETKANVVVSLTKAADDEVTKDLVCKELQRRFADPKQKLKAKAFIDKIAKRNSGIRLSLLNPELFPAIRAEMDVEFAASGNGTGGHHAA